MLFTWNLMFLEIDIKVNIAGKSFCHNLKWIMKRKKTSFIYSGGKRFCRKMGMHMIGRESNSSHLPDSQVYLYYFLHLWPLNRTPHIWWCSGRFSAHHKFWISKTCLQVKGWHLKKKKDRGPPLVILGISGISFIIFVTFLTVIRLPHFV